ncbi:mechanosensitive ion channel family protein [bacterium]|nr:mechanosensitive ion channel family protein [bacterium]
MDNILSLEFLNNRIQDYLTAAGAAVLIIFFLYIIKILIMTRLKRIAERTETDIDDFIIDIIAKFKWPLFVTIGLYFAHHFITLNEKLAKYLGYIAYAVLTYYMIKSIFFIIDYIRQKITAKRAEDERELQQSVVELITNTLKILVLITALLILLQNFGYNISALIAGLGIGGIAIAFALQNVLGDIFASFSIHLDKPFKEGDFIIIGNDSGTVKKIGIKTTRIQALQGQEIVVSNRELTDTRVHNYKKMEKRRVIFSFGLTYQTTVAKLKKVLEITREIFERIDSAQLDRIHFKKFGDFSLIYEVVYYIDSNDYLHYMDTQQVINLALKEEFEKAGIEMAYPTQTIYHSRIE